MKKREALSLEKLRPGMKLAAAVADASGRILLPEGAELSENTIASLARREIQNVIVELEVEEDSAAVELYRQQVMNRLDRLFRRAGQGDETRTLYQIMVKHHMEHR